MFDQGAPFHGSGNRSTTVPTVPGNAGLPQTDSAAVQESSSSDLKLFAANLPDAVPNVASLTTVSTGSAAAEPRSGAAIGSASSESSSANSGMAALHAAVQNSPSLSLIRVPESRFGRVAVCFRGVIAVAPEMDRAVDCAARRRHVRCLLDPECHLRRGSGTRSPDEAFRQFIGHLCSHSGLPGGSRLRRPAHAAQR